jgi:NAD(P)-dependent dehydrogenase (short-subunit alcohol dehydrogenase family)
MTETQNTTHRIQTGFGFQSTTWDVVEGIDLTGRRAVVTGASSGIGIETARALASAGAEVTLAVRDVDAGKRTVDDIVATTGNHGVKVGRLDLSAPTSIAAFTAAWDGPLHLLINNAGVMALQELQLDPRGWEMQFAVNHLGHFALTLGLHHALAAAGGARVVSLSSRGHMYSPVVFDDINFQRREYTPFGAYGQSKTANVLLAVEATRRWAGDGIFANAVHPGGILATNLARHMPTEQMAEYREQERDEAAARDRGERTRFKTLEQGAATSVLVATWPGLEGIGGRYFEDCNEAEPLADGFDPQGELTGIASYAVDPKYAERLWELSIKAVT